MKKTLFFTLAACSVLFCGCFLFTSPNNTENEKRELKTFETNPEDYVYIVKLNTGKGIVNKDETGKVVSNITFPEINNLNTNDFFSTQYNRVKTLLSNNSSRAADSFEAVKKDEINVLNYSKDTSTEKFWTITGRDKNSNYQFTKKDSHCRYEGTYCYVFSDDENDSEDSLNKGINLEQLDSENKNPYEKIGEVFDSIYEIETSILGDATYDEYYSYFAPCTNKIIIYVSDLCGNTHPNQNDGTVGLFNPNDLWSNEFVLSSNGNSNGINNLRIFYIDAYYLTKEPKIVYSTLVHEFNHMINYIQKTLIPTKQDGTTQLYDTWYTEMLSMVTEDMFQHYIGIDDISSPKGRLPYFDIYYNYGFKLWKNNSVEDAIKYANTYAFGAFLARNFGGINLISAIAKNAYVNEYSITKALKECYDKDVDYKYALEKFHLCLINTQKIPDSMKNLKLEKQYYSLNRESKTRNDIYFDAINIASFKVQDQNGKTFTVGPKIYKKNEFTELGPDGFSIHFIGVGLDSFTIDITDKDPKIAIFLTTQ